MDQFGFAEFIDESHGYRLSLIEYWQFGCTVGRPIMAWGPLWGRLSGGSLLSRRLVVVAKAG
jgi:hypothetical protein